MKQALATVAVRNLENSGLRFHGWGQWWGGMHGWESSNFLSGRQRTLRTLGQDFEQQLLSARGKAGEARRCPCSRTMHSRVRLAGL